MNLIVAGASAGLGRALSEELARDGHNLLLISSQEQDLAPLASDLKIRYSTNVQIVGCKVGCDQESIARVRSAAQAFSRVDGVLFPIGYTPDQDDGLLPADHINRIMGSNLTGIMALTAEFLPQFLQRNQGILVYFGSVAAERGRGSNIVYAAAKRGLQSFAESIRHRCSNTQVRVQHYQLGYINTAQAGRKKLLFPAAQPEIAARHIARHLTDNFSGQYYPWFWNFICAALRWTPWCVFKKLKF